ncbi:hypothetical protein KJ359_010168 [Pestalotiopsis sp. 9143b]|nr:hypothetical protein KJ359_010168 [Pestalotiopsis sp. 9143b]
MSEEQATQSLETGDSCQTQSNVRIIARPEGDRHFQRQRKVADEADERTKAHFFRMMKNIAMDMQHSTGKLKLSGGGEGRILDTCMAPGGFLSVVLERNPRATAVAFTLPPSAGGHEVRLPPAARVATHFVDITMLAEDLGVMSIPSDHPDASNFLPKHLSPDQMFDLVICDGQVLRTHHRHEYRELREARRLTVAQLALGLDRLRPGGGMIVLLHKAEATHTICLLMEFAQFSSVRLYKSSRYHATRSSFYMIATSVMSQSPEAIQCIANWKAMWRTATFGTEEDYVKLIRQQMVYIEDTLVHFGPKLVSMAAGIWSTQADGLARAPFMTNKG